MKTQGQNTKKMNSSFTKYSDKFKDILNKIQKKPLQQQKQTHTAQIFHSPIQKQYFFYRIKSIGVGAHSFVYLIQQEETKCIYGQKAINKKHALEHRQQIMNEIKIQSLLNHDNIIRLYHFYKDESYIYLVMQFAEQSLFNLKTKFKIFKEKEVIQVLRQLLSALQYMHHLKMIHADIKIQNIMIGHGKIKLCDFGYARKFQKVKQISSNEMIGTLEYLSPEYVQGLDSGFARDIWAIGIICFQMWTGKNPFQDLKQNQKWLKLVKTDCTQFLMQIQRINQKQDRNSRKVESIIKHTLCPWEKRLSASELLKLDVFQLS